MPHTSGVSIPLALPPTCIDRCIREERLIRLTSQRSCNDHYYYYYHYHYHYHHYYYYYTMMFENATYIWCFQPSTLPSTRDWHKKYLYQRVATYFYFAVSKSASRYIFTEFTKYAFPYLNVLGKHSYPYLDIYMKSNHIHEYTRDALKHAFCCF